MVNSVTVYKNSRFCRLLFLLYFPEECMNADNVMAFHLNAVELRECHENNIWCYFEVIQPV